MQDGKEDIGFEQVGRLLVCILMFVLFYWTFSLCHKSLV